MKMLRLLAGTLLAVSLGTAQNNNYPPSIPDARQEVYKTAGQTALRVWIFEPAGQPASHKRPAIVFFFGGGWKSGTPSQFAPQARYFSTRGLVAILADYRVANRNGAKVKDCIADARSAIRWVRTNAGRLGIDPHRIAAGGGSAGGHLAAATATISAFDGAGEGKVRAEPDALLLFNPALVLAPVEGHRPFPEQRQKTMEQRFGAPPEAVSPYHHLRPHMPPAIIFHGRADTTVPYATTKMFCDRMKSLGNRCELIGYEGAKHGFFNPGRGDGKAYFDTLRRADAFLVSLGWISGPPTVREP